MQPSNRRAHDRDRALGRLARLTSVTAIAGMVGTVGFGGLAALNYSGIQPTTDSTQSTDTNQSTDSDQSSQSTDDTTSTSLSDDPAVQATTPPTTTQIQPVSPPRRSTGRSHVRTGGSGG
jgi:cytoskeletal protein RodZ